LLKRRKLKNNVLWLAAKAEKQRLALIVAEENKQILADVTAEEAEKGRLALASGAGSNVLPTSRLLKRNLLALLLRRRRKSNLPLLLKLRSNVLHALQSSKRQLV